MTDRSNKLQGETKPIYGSGAASPATQASLALDNSPSQAGGCRAKADVRSKRHKPFVVTLEISDSGMSDAEALVRETRLRELAKRAVMARLGNQPACKRMAASGGERDDNA